MGRERTDSEIRNDVLSILAHDIRVDADRIELDVKGGTVYLEGTVTSLYDKRVLTEIANRIKGVAGVVNHVRLTPTAKRPDDEIASEAKAVLARDGRVDQGRVDVNVKDGIVRLLGRVDSYFEKYRAESDVWSVPGIVDIVNDIIEDNREMHRGSS